MCIILIAEDEKDIRDNLVHFLNDEGYKVFITRNGLEAYQTILNIQPDIILSDVNMPIMDGLEFFKRIKANPNTNSIPFIFLSAENKLEKYEEISDGDINFISKPFCFVDLLTVIKNSIKKKNYKN